MPGQDKNLVARLTLDNKSFKSNISDSQKTVLKFSAGVTAAGAAILAATKYTASYNDEMIKSSRVAGIGVESYSALTHASDLSGVSQDQLTKALQKLNATTPAIEAGLKKYGITVKDLNGKTKDADILLSEMADKMGAMENPADRTRLAVAAFGEEGSKMVNLLAGGKDGLKAAADEAERFGLIVSEEAGVNAEKFNDDISRVGQTMVGLRNNLTETIIEMINQSGAMKIIQDSISGITQLWKGMDEETKKIIVTVGSLTVGAGLLAAGIVAIELAAGPAIAALGLISAPVVLITAGIAALVAVVASSIKYWDQVSDAVSPLYGLFDDFIDPLKEDLVIITTYLSTFTGKITDGTENISILGTIAKVSFGIVSAGIITAIYPVRLLVSWLSNASQGIINLGKAGIFALKGDFSSAAKYAKQSMSEFSDIVTDSIDITKDSGQRLANLMDKNYIVSIDKAKKAAKELKAETTDLAQSIGKSGVEIKLPLDQASQSIVNMTSDLEKSISAGEKFKSIFKGIGSIAKALVSEIAKIGNSIANIGKNQAEMLNRSLDKELKKLEKNYDKNVEKLKDSEKEKLDALESNYKKQLRLIEYQEESKNNAIELAAKERLLLLDEEYQEAKKIKEQEFQEFIEQERLKFEANKETLIQSTADKEQAQIVESKLNEDWNQYNKDQEQKLNEEILALTGDLKTKKENVTKEMNETIADNNQTANDAKKSADEAYNSSVETQTEETNTALTELFDSFNKDQNKLEKEKLQNQYDANKKAYEINKATSIANVIIAGIVGGINAFTSLSAIPVAGVPLGIAAAAAFAITTGIAIADIESTPPPEKPAGLGSGGYIAGNMKHSRGGYLAEIESKEFMIDAQRTSKIENAIDSNLIAGGGLSLYFTEGSIQNYGKDITTEFIDMISDSVAIKLRREGIMA